MIYFDNAASSRPEGRAIEVFSVVNAEAFGNPNSTHGFGFAAKRIDEKARQDILRALKIEKTHSLIFTSGPTEANNMAIKSIAFQYKNRGRKIITSAVEHASVLNAFYELRDEFGFEVLVLPVCKDGYVLPQTLASAMDKNVILVSMMAVNNETGAIFPTKALAGIVHKFPKAYFHVDATQAIGKVKFDYGCADMLSCSAHKFGGFKGTGFLTFRKSIQFLPLLSGGEQEFGYRGGTVNVAGNAAMAEVLKSHIENLDSNSEKVKELVCYLRDGLSSIAEIEFNSPENSSPYVLNFSFALHKASVLVEGLSEKEIYVSSVSACNSKGEPVSNVLLAMGYSKERAGNSMRVSILPTTTKEEIDTFLATLKTLLQEVNPR